jgi:hypothetical protein
MMLFLQYFTKKSPHFTKKNTFKKSYQAESHGQINLPVTEAQSFELTSSIKSTSTFAEVLCFLLVYLVMLIGLASR